MITKENKKKWLTITLIITIAYIVYKYFKKKKELL